MLPCPKPDADMPELDLDDIERNSDGSGDRAGGTSSEAQPQLTADQIVAMGSAVAAYCPTPPPRADQIGGMAPLSS